MKFFLRYATKAAKPSECCAAGNYRYLHHRLLVRPSAFRVAPTIWTSPCFCLNNSETGTHTRL